MNEKIGRILTQISNKLVIFNWYSLNFSTLSLEDEEKKFQIGEVEIN